METRKFACLQLVPKVEPKASPEYLERQFDDLRIEALEDSELLLMDSEQFSRVLKRARNFLRGMTQEGIPGIPSLEWSLIALHQATSLADSSDRDSCLLFIKLAHLANSDFRDRFDENSFNTPVMASGVINCANHLQVSFDNCLQYLISGERKYLLKAHLRLEDALMSIVSQFTGPIKRNAHIGLN
ncbi:MAG: hypothetical protein KDD53_09275 [Bdellovibrionales bacterium]|nr:hypothetical protein [Bdellovibrionales bacterium]